MVQGLNIPEELGAGRERGLFPGLEGEGVEGVSAEPEEEAARGD